LRCSLCGKQAEDIEEGYFCSGCWTLLEKNELPDLDYSEYFQEGLESKLKEVDTYLFNLPENFFLWYLKGHLEHELGNIKKALRSINTSISYRNDHGDSWMRLGLIFSDLHKEKEAIEKFQKGMEFELHDPTNLVDAGISLQASGHPALAAGLLKRALSLSPEDHRAIVALGKAHIQIGDNEKAQKVLKRGFELFPHNEEVLRGIAQLMIKDGDLEGAKEMYGRILDQNPKDFEGLLAMGEIHLKTGEFTRSLKYYNAVRDLDIHISWPGVLRFIVSSLQGFLSRNENFSTYNDELKKEFENVRSYLDDLEGMVEGSRGAGPLEELENLVRVMDNQKIRIKEQLKGFTELLTTYKVEDSFYRHLHQKAEDLRKDLEHNRIYDAKQLAYELSPFLTDLKEADSKTMNRLRKDIEGKLKELDQLGMGAENLKGRLEEVEELEREGNIQGATFLLKEIDVSLTEYWEDMGKGYYDEKRAEMARILESAQGKFDTSSLRNTLTLFEGLYLKGPLAVREAYLSFLKKYEQDSADYYSRECDRVIQEMKYKLLLLEKDGADSTGFVEELEGQKEMRKDLPPKKAFSMLSDLFDRITEFEDREKESTIRKRIDVVETLVSSMEKLGFSVDLDNNVGSVLSTIERSLEKENTRLAEILINELMENVNEVLNSQYREDLQLKLEEVDDTIDDLVRLGFDGEEWRRTLLRSRERSEESGDLMDSAISLAFLITTIEEDTDKRLENVIERNFQKLDTLLDEGKRIGLDLRIHEKEASKLRKGEVDLELLETTHSLSLGVDKKVSDKLKDLSLDNMESSNRKADELLEKGHFKDELKNIMGRISRIGFLIEEKEPRKAYVLSEEVLDEIQGLETRESELDFRNKLGSLEKMLEVQDQLGLDTSSARGKMVIIRDHFRDEPQRSMEDLLEVNLEARKKLGDHLSRVIAESDKELRRVMKESDDSIPQSDLDGMNSTMHIIKTLRSENRFDELPSLISKLRSDMERVGRVLTERDLFDRVSDILDRGLSLQDIRANALVAKAQKLAEKVQAGKLEGLEEKVRAIQKEVSELESIVLLSRIEGLLTEIGDLDQLAKEVFSNVKDPSFDSTKVEIRKMIDELMENTNRLYSSPDTEEFERSVSRIDGIKMAMLEMENESRALNRIKLINRITDDPRVKVPKDLTIGIKELRSLYQKRDFTAFFRKWDSMEDGLRSHSERGGKEIDLDLMTTSSDVRDSELRRKIEESIKDRRTNKPLGAISKIASEAFRKTQKMDERAPEPKAEDEDDIPEAIELVGGGERKDGGESLAGVARLIAGTRIEGLQQEESEALESGDGKKDEERPGGAEVPVSKTQVRGEVITSIVDDFFDLDTSTQSTPTSSEMDRIRKKLENLLKRAPDIDPLKEARDHYTQGVSYMDLGKESAAKRSFRLAISSATKILKAYQDIGKALSTLKGTLDRAESSGVELREAKKLYTRANSHYRKGKLMEAALAIRRIKEELKKAG